MQPTPLSVQPERSAQSAKTDGATMISLGFSRKTEIRQHANAIARDRDAWIARNRGFYKADRAYMRFLIPEGASVLDIGCGTGELLDALRPSRAVGIDLSAEMIAIARDRNPSFEYHVGDAEDPAVLGAIKGPFDFIILSDTIGLLDDIEAVLSRLHPMCTPETRLIIAYHTQGWEPLLNMAEKIGRRMPQPPVNFLSTVDFMNLLDLSDFELIRSEARQILPVSLFGLGGLINRYIATLPGVRLFCLRRYIVARSRQAVEKADLSATVLIPCRNERGNIEDAILRMPRFAPRQEIVFVEGNSKDGTYEECLRVQEKYQGQWDIKVFKQAGKGKGDAVRKGFAEASGDVLMILDADLTVPPETLPKFYNAINSGKAEFVNGTRLVYPMQDEAMRPLNLIANRFFASVFTYLINQRFSDTLCGTKVLKRSAYQKIAAGRKYFGDFDPFGDFDLIFGAAKTNLKIVEVPIRYAARTYGETQISRFRDGFMLLQMVMFAFKKLKAI
jgi:SAM-dependent methyltransferase